MGSDDFFKKKKAATNARKKELRTPKPNSYLIVTEGAKTEPLYLRGLADHIHSKYGENISIKPLFDIRGEGRSTVSLVQDAARIASRGNILYENIWVVFDKDDFNDFDEAIELAESYGFKVAWSNQSFEYWLYLHFHYSDAALHRNDWLKKLDDIFKDMEIDPNGYKKNDEDIFRICTEFGNIKYAISNAKRINETHKNKHPSQSNPCTTVHEMILSLKPYLEDLI